MNTSITNFINDLSAQGSAWYAEVSAPPGTVAASITPAGASTAVGSGLGSLTSNPLSLIVVLALVAIGGMLLFKAIR